MKRVIAIALLPFFFALGNMGLGCGDPNDNSTPGQATETRIEDAVNGTPDAITIGASAALTDALTAAELLYLGSLDWRLLGNGGVFSDPTARKALTALMPLVQDKSLHARAIEISLINKAYAQTTDACSTTYDYVVNAVISAFGKSANGDGSCIEATLSSGGGWQSCLAAGLASIAIAIDASGCKLDNPTLPDPTKAANEALGCETCNEEICNRYTGKLKNCTDADAARLCAKAIKSISNQYYCDAMAFSETSTCLQNIDCSATDLSAASEACAEKYWGPWHDKSADEYTGSSTVKTGWCPHSKEAWDCVTACTNSSYPCVVSSNSPVSCPIKITDLICDDFTEGEFLQCKVSCFKNILP